MKDLILTLCLVFASISLFAQKPVWQPSPGHTQVPIWPAAAPDAQPAAGPEDAAAVTDEPVAGYQAPVTPMSSGGNASA
jgi:hypothetical protein